MMSNSASRQTFVQSVVNFIQTYNFDGLDIDIEYPGDLSRGGRVEDKNNYLSLVQDLRAAFDRVNRNWQITLAVTIDPTRMQNGYNIPGLCS